MQIPQTPEDVEKLDLMVRLKQYADGASSWFEGNPGTRDRHACQSLYTKICDFVRKAVAPLLDQINTREMEHFTMHDRVHALKVAHLMWHILLPERRQRLTPPEIGMLVLAAHLHDLGMIIPPREREEWLGDNSDLWKRLESDESTRKRFRQLQKRSTDTSISETERARLLRQLAQCEEALLCEHVRERHATRERYHEVLGVLRKFSHENPNIPDPMSVLSFQDDTFQDQITDICVSHNQDADVFSHFERGEYRFRTRHPFGNADADLLMIAAALRLADILDFDRERTPPALFQYLMPGPLAPEGDRSVLEWSKHMAISKWHIEKEEIIYDGNCDSHIVHHAIVQFCREIAAEIEKTRRAFEQRGHDWPFQLPRVVKAEIHAKDYVYMPYRFELDDQRIYELLMGGAIYQNPLVAVRELIQNAVDACQYLDALSQLGEAKSEEGISRPPDFNNRIFVTYVEPENAFAQPRLIVKDRGLGMNQYILETYFLRVGQSIYRSQEFNRHRTELREHDLDFAPVSEFGIGFLSCFLLADRVEVETAMAEPWKGDIRKHTLIIDGPTRLIRYAVDKNDGTERLKGTAVTLYLARGGKHNPLDPPSWSEIKDYITEICEELPYDIKLKHDATEDGVIPRDEKPLSLRGSRDNLFRVEVRDNAVGIKGEVYLERSGRRANETNWSRSTLIRGGLKIGDVPGIPHRGVDARVRMTWKNRPLRRYMPPNLARTGPAEIGRLRKAIARCWIRYLLDKRDSIPMDYAVVAYRPELSDLDWLSKSEDDHGPYDGYAVYSLARKGWAAVLGIGLDRLEDWEHGRGSALKYDDGFFLHDLFLGLLLPRISKQEIDGNGNLLVKPLPQGWRDMLQGCDYISAPRPWPEFAAFAGQHERWLAVLNPPRSRFNEIYREIVRKAFQSGEMPELLDTLDRVLRFKQYQECLGWTHRHSRLWCRAKDQFSHLAIGETGQFPGYSIRDLREPGGDCAQPPAADGPLDSSDVL